MRTFQQIMEDAGYECTAYSGRGMGGTGGGDARDPFFRFEREAQAKRVASRCNKELKAYRKGEPVLEGTKAQMVFMMAGGTRAPGFALNAYRGRIAGT